MSITFISKLKSLFVVLLFPFTVSAFGVLTHEAIVDASWDHTILPLLKEKFPRSSPEELNDAHAYAYGGAVAPDMGYYPFGSKLFTNLVHYVRSGDMVNALLENAENINEYAFALGFLSHYSSDKYGHPMATNMSVPLVYPKMQRKFGDTVTYGNNHISHLRMEFGFDVLEVVKGNYASQEYRNLIGFKVDTSVLARAFLQVYGLSIHEVFNHHFNLSVETFRWVVANIFPMITKQAWANKRGEILKYDSSATAKNFKFKMRQRQYNKQFGKHYKRPGFSATMISLVLRIVPKVGPLRALRFKPPTPESEKLFITSFDTILHHYTLYAKQLPHAEHQLKDIDFDTGLPTKRREYSLADQTYQDWLLELDKEDYANLDAEIKDNIIKYFNLQKANDRSKKPSRRCRKFANASMRILEHR